MFKKNISLKHIHKYFVLALVLTIFILFSVSSIAMNYVPSKPSGPVKGLVDENYSYMIVSSEPGSRWIFDWGDGTFSSWITFNSSSFYKIQTHSYSSPGVYQIKIKYKNEYDEESKWSQPLDVTIYAEEESNFDYFGDNDGDGWSNIIEKLCGTSMYNSEIYPDDNDGDGMPDETKDDNITADPDDDNDGLEDYIELEISSDPFDDSDVTKIEYEKNVYFLVDTDKDKKFDKYFVKYQGETTKALDLAEGENLMESLNKKIAGNSEVQEKNPEKSILDFPLWGFIIAVFLVILIVFILFKTGIVYIYEEEIDE